MNTLSGKDTAGIRRFDRTGFFYGYTVVAASFGIQALIWGVFNSYGIFFDPLLNEFGWSRATISGAASVSQVLVGVGAISLGYLNDRFGPRLLMAASAVVAGLGYALIYGTASVWQLYLFHGVIVGIGVSGTDVILLSTTARWFVKRRGMMSGIVKIGTGVGIMVAPFVVQRLIAAYGWRDSFLIIGIAIAVLGVAASQLLKRDPSKVGQYPDGGTAQPEVENVLDKTGQTLREASRTRRFWMFNMAFLITLFCTFSVIIQFPTSTIESGFSTTLATTLLSLIGGASIAGRLLMGMVGDRIGSKRGFLICFALLTASLWWLTYTREAWGLVIFALVYGFCHGGFYALMSPMVAEFFGLRSHGAIFGVVIWAGSIGGALGPWVTGRMADTAGNYHAAFLLMAILAAVGFVLMLGAGPVPARTPSR